MRPEKPTPFVVSQRPARSEAAIPPLPTRTADAPANVAELLAAMARSRPDQTAIVRQRAPGLFHASDRAPITFAELEAYANRIARGMVEIGVGRGTRTLVMVRPGRDFVAVTFALFKIGAIPVMIDPGMGVGRMLECLRQVDVEALVGVPTAQALRLARPAAFRTVRRWVTVGSRWSWGGVTLRQIAEHQPETFTPAPTSSADTAAILFTSGSTGPAKGVVYEHGMFAAQVTSIQSRYGIEPGEVDLPAFPLFALFSVAMGMTAVIPDMDASRPGRTNPKRIVSAILDHGVTNSFGSPAIWRRVGPYCVERGIRLPTIRRILIAGASVPRTTIEQLLRSLPETADVHTPYGATEALPVASISGRELLDGPASQTLAGAGTCVGRAWPGVEIRALRVTDDPLQCLAAADEVAQGEAGELAVRGAVVTRAYFNLPEATRRSKIQDGDLVWHRMGDIGRVDDEGRVWFHGRKSQRVWTTSSALDTDRCEPIFNAHPDVARCALVGVGASRAQVPVVVVEPRPGAFPRRLRDRLRFCSELQVRANACPTTRGISRFLFHHSLPVDVRHNAKIDREALAAWAARRLG